MKVRRLGFIRDAMQVQHGVALGENKVGAPEELQHAEETKKGIYIVDCFAA